MSNPDGGGGGGGADDDRSYWAIIAAAGLVTVAAVAGVAAYFWWSSGTADDEGEAAAKKKLGSASSSSTTVVVSDSTATSRKAVAGPLAGDLSADDQKLFPWHVESYKTSLPRLHQCYCGQKADAAHQLSRCSVCKATYYCSNEHQKHAWANPPYLHRTFCHELQNVLRGGFNAITNYMKVFSPANAQNIHASTSVEGWTIACAALERELYVTPYEEAKLVAWAGTCHVMMSGQLLKAQVTSLDLDALLSYFGAGINFFMNALQIAQGHDRELEVLPFCRFELFGLWSTLGLSFKETDPDRMGRMFQRAAVLYGIPAIEELLQLLALGDDCPIEWELAIQYLQGWVSSVLSILTQRPSSFRLAFQLMSSIEEFARDTDAPGAIETFTFAQILYESAVAAELAVNASTGVATAMWGAKELELFQHRKDEIARQRVAEAYPGVMEGQ